MSRDYEKLRRGYSDILQTLKHTALRLQSRCNKANSSTCNFPSNQSNVLKSRGVCASNWFFTKHFIKQSKARITNSDILIVAKRWNPEKEDMSSLLICPLKDYVKRWAPLLLSSPETSSLACNVTQFFPLGKECMSLLQFCVIPLSDSITKDRRRICGPASGGCMFILLTGKFKNLELTMKLQRLKIS